MLKLISTALAGAAMLAATPALAQDSTMSVSTAGINLASDTGRAELDKRLLKAANKLCDTGSAGGHMQLKFVTCRDDVLASAKGQVSELAARNADGRIQLARAR